MSDIKQYNAQISVGQIKPDELEQFVRGVIGSRSLWRRMLSRFR